jgi:hypothetical protein
MIMSPASNKRMGAIDSKSEMGKPGGQGAISGSATTGMKDDQGETGEMPMGSKK